MVAYNKPAFLIHTGDICYEAGLKRHKSDMNTDESMKIVMFNHTNAPNDDYVISFNRKELDLKQHNLIAWIYGHYHDSRIVNNSGVAAYGRPVNSTPFWATWRDLPDANYYNSKYYTVQTPTKYTRAPSAPMPLQATKQNTPC